MVLKTFLIAALALPGTAAIASTDVSSFSGWPDKHTALVEPKVGAGQGATVGARGPAGARVLLTIDMSTMDTARVAIDPPCPLSGQVIRCDLTLDGYGSAQVYLRFQVIGGTAGPAGYLTVRAEPVGDTDPDTSNNASRLDVDVVIDAVGSFTVRAADVEGAVGDTVTVPVVFANKGPNTMRGVTISHPAGGSGTDFAGGDGCVLAPAPQCEVGRIPPGASKTVNLRFHIRRCSEYSQPSTGGIPVSVSTWMFRMDERGSDTAFQIRVRDCARDFSSRTPPGPSASPSATQSPQQPPGGLQLSSGPQRPDTARTDVAKPLSNGLAALLLTVAGLVAFVRLRRRRNGL